MVAMESVDGIHICDGIVSRDSDFTAVMSFAQRSPPLMSPDQIRDFHLVCEPIISWAPLELCKPDTTAGGVDRGYCWNVLLLDAGREEELRAMLPAIHNRVKVAVITTER